MWKVLSTGSEDERGATRRGMQADWQLRRARERSALERLERMQQHLDNSPVKVDSVFCSLEHSCMTNSPRIRDV